MEHLEDDATSKAYVWFSVLLERLCCSFWTSKKGHEFPAEFPNFALGIEASKKVSSSATLCQHKERVPGKASSTVICVEGTMSYASVSIFQVHNDEMINKSI